MSRSVVITRVEHPPKIEYRSIGGRKIALNAPVTIKIHLGNQEGCYKFRLEKDFWSDGRSGPAMFDRLIPHLGKTENLVSVLVHDALCYDIGLSIQEANRVLNALWKFFKNDDVTCTEADCAKVFTDLLGPMRFGPIGKDEELNSMRVHFEWCDR